MLTFACVVKISNCGSVEIKRFKVFLLLVGSKLRVTFGEDQSLGSPSGCLEHTEGVEK
jgi:hypothetical protein